MKRRIFLKNLLFLPSFTFAKGNTSSITPWHIVDYGDFSFQKVVKNLYIMHGINNQKNISQCFVHNPAFIESKNGIILIDSGATYNIGKEILIQIERISSKPIIAIFNTHHHSDHWFANGAIEEKYPNVKIYAHKNFVLSAKEQYFNKYQENRTYTRAKKISLPTLFVKDSQTIDIDGEIFHIQHPLSAHTNCDITITHKRSNVIFLGDIALEASLSNFGNDASILNNISFLEKIQQQKEYTLYVPGHGSSGAKKNIVTPYLTYLQIIKEEVQKAYNEDKNLYELKECEEKILSRLNWEEEFNFPLKFVQSHMQSLYFELEASF